MDVIGRARPGHDSHLPARSAKRMNLACLFVLCLAAPAVAADVPLSERKSGYEFMSRETRAMQDDDTTNPGMLWVLDGEALWKRKAGEANKSCADCHADAPASMKGVAARYPAFDVARGRPVNLDERINICRTDQQKATKFADRGKGPAGAVGLRDAPVARDADRRQGGRPHASVHRGGPEGVSSAGKASSTCPAPTAMTTIGDRSLPAHRSRRRIPPATRNTGWNGRRSARCSGGCATAWSACAPNPSRSARRTLSSSKSTWRGGRAACRSRRPPCGLKVHAVSLWNPSSGDGPHTVVVPGTQTLGRCGVS